MALMIHLLPPKLLPQPTKFHPHPFFPSPSLLRHTPKTLIWCTNSISDADLASDFATEAEKINTHLAQREEAMKKSTQILFTELCQYLGLSADEVENQWKKMDEDGKWGLVKGFVSEWGINFHPLSARSVKEMVDEHLG